MARHNYFKSILSCLIVFSLILALSFTSSTPVSAASYYDYCSSEALITLNDDIEDITIAEEIASKYGYEYKGIYEWDPSGPKTVVIDTHATEGLEDILAVLLSDESIKEVLFLPQYVKRILTLEFNKEVGEETVAREILAPYPCEIVRSRTVNDSLYVTVKIADGADYWSVRRDLLLEPNVNYGYMSWIPVNNTPYAPIVDEEENESPIAEKPEFIDNTNEDDSDNQNISYDENKSDTSNTVNNTRLFGSNRYYTMQAVSQEGWADDSCDTVIVATGADFPDALAGSALAGLYGSPIILTNPNSLSPAARAEIIRLNPDHVIILGSANAVSDTVKASIESIVSSGNVTRVYGSNRYGTSKAIYDAGVGNWSDTLILATGAAAPDALSIAPYAYASGSPIFLVKSDGETLLEGMRTAIANDVFEKVIIVGAPEVISSNLETWVKAQVGASNVIRLYGSNRYKTSSAIAEWETGNMANASFGPDTPLTYTYPGMAHGGDDHFADALAGGSYCGHNGSVLLLTKDLATSANYTVTHNVVPHRTEISNGFVIGSSEVLSIDFLNYLNTVTVQ